MDRRARARELVSSALSAVEGELATPRHALSATELDTCRDTLRRYLDELERDALPPRSDRGEALGRIVVDSWSFDVPLAPIVLQAERAWRTC